MKLNFSQMSSIFCKSKIQFCTNEIQLCTKIYMQEKLTHIDKWFVKYKLNEKRALYKIYI